MMQYVEADREFAAAIEKALPTGAMVFQIPVMEFPESPVPGVASYAHFRPYLYSKALRFSFGTMKGRERDQWQHQMAALPLKKQVQEIKDRGFAAIYLNRNGLPDRGKALEETLRQMGYKTPPLSNASGELACFILKTE